MKTRYNTPRLDNLIQAFGVMRVTVKRDGNAIEIVLGDDEDIENGDEITIGATHLRFEAQ